MVLLAFSLQDQIDKYGTYVGIAAFFGLAVLTLLYFAQAREVKRLREWAGRAPERAAELEQAVLEHAEEARRAPATPVPAAQPAPAHQLAQTVPATNGVVKLKPAEVAALAFARSAGVHEPHEPKPHPVPVATAAAPELAAPAPEVAAAGAAVAAGEPADAQAVNGGGAGHPPVPKPATPAARRVEPPAPPPLPPRRVAAAAAGRRTTTAPPPRESSTRAVVFTVIVGVLVLAGAVYGVLQLSGGGEDPVPRDNVVVTATPDGGGGEEPAATATPAASVTKETALIAVFNATGATGLARTNAGYLIAEGYPDDNVDTGNLDQRQASVVLYARGARQAADGVADVLGISSIKQLADDPQVQARVEQSETKWHVVAVVGADKN